MTEFRNDYMYMFHNTRWIYP